MEQSELKAHLETNEKNHNSRGLAEVSLNSAIHPGCQRIYERVCKKPIIDLDPTGTVHSDDESEKEAHEIYREIVRKNPDWTPDQVDEAFVSRVFTPENRAKIHSAFYLVKRKLNHWIDQQPDTVFNSQEKSVIKSRIRKVELQLPPPARLYQDEPDLLTKSELLYERKVTGETSLRVGGAYLLFAKSWFNVVFSLAHELGHAIDPCEIRSAGLSFPAYDRLVGCFLEHRLIAMRKTRSECGGNDQLSETFADWVAVQITAEILANYSTRLNGKQMIHAAQNSVRDLCESEPGSEDRPDIEFHPSPQIRIEEIFGKNPKIRKLLGCETPIQPQSYCQFDPTLPLSSGGI